MRRMTPADAVDAKSMYKYYWEIRPHLTQPGKLIRIHAGFDADNVTYFDNREQMNIPSREPDMRKRGIVICVGNESARDIFWRDIDAIEADAPPDLPIVVVYRDPAKPRQYFATYKEAYADIDVPTLGDFCVKHVKKTWWLDDTQQYDHLPYFKEVQSEPPLQAAETFQFQ